MFHIFNRISWILAFLAGWLVWSFSDWLFIPAVIVVIWVKYFLSDDFLKENILSYNERLKKSFLSEIQSLSWEKNTQNSLEKEDFSIIDSLPVEEWASVSDQIEKTESLEQLSSEQRNEWNGFLQTFFAENILAKIWGILLSIGMIFFMTYLFWFVGDGWKMILWFLVAGIFYSIWAKLFSTYQAEWVILIGTSLIIQYIVVLVGYHILWWENGYLSIGTAFWLLCLVTFFSLISSKIFSSIHLFFAGIFVGIFIPYLLNIFASVDSVFLFLIYWIFLQILGAFYLFITKDISINLKNWFLSTLLIWSLSYVILFPNTEINIVFLKWILLFISLFVAYFFAKKSSWDEVLYGFAGVSFFALLIFLSSIWELVLSSYFLASITLFLLWYQILHYYVSYETKNNVFFTLGTLFSGIIFAWYYQTFAANISYVIVWLGGIFIIQNIYAWSMKYFFKEDIVYFGMAHSTLLLWVLGFLMYYFQTTDASNILQTFVYWSISVILLWFSFLSYKNINFWENKNLITLMYFLWWLLYFWFAIFYLFADYEIIRLMLFYFQFFALVYFAAKISSSKIAFWASIVWITTLLMTIGNIFSGINTEIFDTILYGILLLTLGWMFFVTKFQENSFFQFIKFLFLLWLTFVSILFVDSFPALSEILNPWIWYVGIFGILWLFLAKWRDEFALGMITIAFVLWWLLQWLFFAETSIFIQLLITLWVVWCMVWERILFPTKILSTRVFVYGIYFFVITSLYLFEVMQDSFTLTIYWTLLSSFALFLWIFKDLSRLRKMWLYVLLLVLFKVIFYDVWNTIDNPLIRIIAIMWVGWIMMYVSILYSKMGFNLKNDILLWENKN